MTDQAVVIEDHLKISQHPYVACQSPERQWLTTAVNFMMSWICIEPQQSNAVKQFSALRVVPCCTAVEAAGVGAGKDGLQAEGAGNLPPAHHGVPHQRGRQGGGGRFEGGTNHSLDAPQKSA
jgi:hypothetical protein